MTQGDRRQRRGIGAASVSRRAAWGMTIAFAATIAAVPLVDRAHTARTRGAEALYADLVRVWPRAPQIESAFADAAPWDAARTLNRCVMRGIGRFEHGLQEASPIEAATAPILRSAVTGLLGGGSDAVFAGWSGWLFYRPDIESLSGPGFLDPRAMARRARGSATAPAAAPDPVRAIGAFRDALARRGIALAVVPTPVKPAIYPERFALRYDGTQPVLNASYAEFLRRVQDAGAVAIDLAGPLMAAKRRDPATPLFLAGDSHWSPAGAAVAAEAIAAQLGAAGLVVAPASARDAPAQRRVAGIGDLAAMLAYPAAVRPSSVEEVAVREPPRIAGRGAASVLLLGDSFANIYSDPALGWGANAGLPELLEAALGAPVETIAVDGDGALASRMALSRDAVRGIGRLDGKRVVVWQFAMRALSFGDWQCGLPLAPRARPAPGSFLRTERVRGRIAALSAPPQPGGTPYRDAAIAWRLDGVRALEGGGGAAERLVYLWGMRGNEWTAAVRCDVGDTVDLVLLPWDAARPFVGGAPRVEIDETAAAGLPAYWAVTDPAAARLLGVTLPPPAAG